MKRPLVAVATKEVYQSETERIIHMIIEVTGMKLLADCTAQRVEDDFLGLTAYQRTSTRVTSMPGTVWRSRSSAVWPNHR